MHLFLVRLDELQQVLSRHHGLDAEEGQPSAVVRDAILRVVVRPNLLASVHGAHLRFPLPHLFLDVLLVLDFKKPLLEDVSGSFLVAILTPVLLDEDTHAAWQVSRPAGTFSLID